MSKIEPKETIDLWDGKPPYDNGEKAELTIYLANKNEATGRAVLIVPGGAYRFVAIEHEGFDWASFFIPKGISCFVLKYRMPKGNRLVPIGDAEQAMKLIRRNAEKWNIDPNQVGIMGFSAGGHLSSTIATHSKLDAKPNFHILFYPVITMDPSYTHLDSMKNFLGSDNPTKQLIEEFSNEKQITKETSPVFIVLSNDDVSVPPLNGVNYYLECNKQGVSASLHIYPTGGHGWGYRDSFAYHTVMVKELEDWLKSF
jgi:acetyl esterase/lipase